MATLVLQKNDRLKFYIMEVVFRCCKHSLQILISSYSFSKYFFVARLTFILFCEQPLAGTQFCDLLVILGKQVKFDSDPA